MELPELSLAPSWSRLTLDCSSSESSDTSSSRKRKAVSDSFLETKSSSQATHCNIIDLQHSSERLPLDWEQCLDLQSGKMYFMNRKTLKKSWDRPSTSTHEDHYLHQHISQKLNLELSISSSISGKPKPPSVVTNKLLSQMKKTELATAQTLDIFGNDGHIRSISTFASVAKDQMKKTTTTSSNDNMAAIACMNCHMFVIVSKSSPTCPNCKFVHSIPQPAARQTSPVPATRKH